MSFLELCLICNGAPLDVVFHGAASADAYCHLMSPPLLHRSPGGPGPWQGWPGHLARPRRGEDLKTRRPHHPRAGTAGVRLARPLGHQHPSAGRPRPDAAPAAAAAALAAHHGRDSEEPHQDCHVEGEEMMGRMDLTVLLFRLWNTSCCGVHSVNVS